MRGDRPRGAARRPALRHQRRPHGEPRRSSRPSWRRALAARGTDEWVARAEEAGVPAGPIHDYAEVFADPHTQAREMEVEMEHPVEGTVRGLGIPVKLTDTPGSIRRAAPLLGEHTEEVLREAGFADERDRGARVSVRYERARPGGVGHLRPPRGAQRDDVRDVRGAVRRAARRPTPTTTCARWCCAARAARRSWPAPTSASSRRSRPPRTASSTRRRSTASSAAWSRCGKPTVALVDGYAMGSGPRAVGRLRPARLHAGREVRAADRPHGRQLPLDGELRAAGRAARRRRG